MGVTYCRSRTLHHWRSTLRDKEKQLTDCYSLRYQSLLPLWSVVNLTPFLAAPTVFRLLPLQSGLAKYSEVISLLKTILVHFIPRILKIQIRLTNSALREKTQINATELCKADKLKKQYNLTHIYFFTL